MRRKLCTWALRVRHGKGIKVDTSSEEILSKEGSLFEEEESGLYLCLMDGIEVTMMDIVGDVRSHEEDEETMMDIAGDVRSLEEGRTLEEETDFTGIDRELQTRLQISRDVLDVNVKLAKR